MLKLWENPLLYVDDRLKVAIGENDRLLQEMKNHGWKQMDSAPKDGTPILGLCVHDADRYWSDTERKLTTYGAHAEYSTHTEDGPNVVVWGGGYTEYDEYSGKPMSVPDWWFLRGSDLLIVANPVLWKPIDMLCVGNC